MMKIINFNIKLFIILFLLNKIFLYSCEINRDLSYKKIHPFYSQVLYDAALQLYGLTGDKVDALNEGISSAVREREEMEASEGEFDRISDETHRLWYTRKSNSQEMTLDRLENYRNSLRFNVNKRNLFWCADPSDIPETIKTIESFEISVEIHRISEIFEKFICKDLIRALIEDGYITFATDLIRKEILYYRGGIYADSGLKQIKDIDDKLRKFSHLFFLRPWGEIDVGIMAAPARSPLLRMDLDFVKALFTDEKTAKIVIPDASIHHCFLSSYHLNVLVTSSYKDNKSFKFGFLCENEDCIPVSGAGNWGARLFQGLGYFSTSSLSRLYDFLPSVNVNIIYPAPYEGESNVANSFNTVLSSFGISSSVHHNPKRRSGIYNIDLILSLLSEKPYSSNEFSQYSYLYSHVGTAIHGKNMNYSARSFKFSLQVGAHCHLPKFAEYGSKSPFYFTCPKTAFEDFNPIEATIVYFGGWWDRRYDDALSMLEELSALNWYGSERLAHKKSYRGFSDSVENAIKKHRIVLVLHSQQHLDNEEPTRRIFEAASAGAIIISDRHQFILDNFGNSILYINQKDPPSKIAEDIMMHYRWIIGNPEEALALARHSHEIFINAFSLDEHILKFFETHQEALVLDGKKSLFPRRNFSYTFEREEIEKLNRILKIVMAKKIKITNSTGSSMVVPLLFSFFKKRDSYSEKIKFPDKMFYEARDSKIKEITTISYNKGKVINFDLHMYEEIEDGQEELYDCEEHVFVTGIDVTQHVLSYELRWNSLLLDLILR